MVTDARAKEFFAVRDGLQWWAADEGAIVAVALVGSWAREAARMDSDVDVVVMATDTTRYVEQEEWIQDLHGPDAELVRTAEWGVLVERRVRLPSGFEVEYGFVDPSWADTEPVDPGTRRVTTDGCVAWYDPLGVVSKLLLAVAD